MKKYYLSSLIAIVLVVAPAFSNAQTIIDVGGATNIGASLDNGPGSVPPAGLPGVIKQRLQNDVNAYNTRVQNVENNVQNNQDYRNAILEDHPGFASGTPPFRGSDERGMPGRFGSTSPAMLWQNASTSIPKGNGWYLMRAPLRTALIKRFASSTIFASSTLMENLNAMRGHDRSLRLDLFAWQQNNLVDQLTKAMANLAEIRGRIADRIQTAEASGTDMTEATALLATADADIAAADQDIQTVSSYVPLVPSQAEASTTVDLTQPRVLGASAIQAVDNAREALNDVVVAIARALGIKLAPPSPVEQSSNAYGTTTTQ